MVYRTPCSSFDHDYWWACRVEGMTAVKTPRGLTAGFTLVELVITLVLIGILSALGIGLLASPSTYSAGAARDQFVATAQLAQQWALANTGDVDETAELRIDEFDNRWEFSVFRSGDDDNPVLGPKEAERENASLEPDTQTISYDNNGRLSSDADLELTFSGESDHQACISALGFAYPGGCR